MGVAGETTNGPNNHGPQMVVPVGQTVQITLVSDDVIHGFYLRDFNFSRYALPGVTNVFDLNVIHTGTYNGQCTQILRALPLRDAVQRAGGQPGAVQLWASAEVRTGHALQQAARRPPTSRPVTPPSTPSDALPAPSTAKGSA